jgi:rhamnose transport system ATP-binding protein
VKEILALKRITKWFTGTMALSEIDFNLYPGEVHALVGENGAGKSTLIKIITGIYQPDNGDVILNSEKVVFPDARASYDHGIAAIYQEASLFEDLSIAENIYMGHQEIRPFTRNIKWAALYAKADEFIRSLEVNLDSHALVKSLSIAEKQLVEIITVIRDGKMVGTVTKEQLDVNELVRMMVGRNLKTMYPKYAVTIGEPSLRVEGLSRAGEFHDITFDLRRGEIVGLSGLVGAGRTEVARSIFGVVKPEGGRIFIEGQQVRIENPRQALERGIAYLSESRVEYGLILQMTITQNITVPILKRFSRFGWINRGNEEETAKKFFELLDIRASSLDQKVGSLSGGNQQKVSIAKWLALNAKILILDEPTKGIDVGTKAAVHKLMSDLANDGKAILMISSEIPEIIGMSDRILVMHEGILVSELSRSEATQEKILTAALG